MDKTNEELLDAFRRLIEDTTGPSADNIAAADENLTADQMFQQTELPSLGKQIFSVVPMHGPTAALFNVKRKDGTNDFELVRKEVEVYPSEAIHTGITQEAIQDIRGQYGKSANVMIGTLLRGLSNEQENTRTMEFLDANALDYGALVLSDSKNAEVNLFEVTQRVHEIVLKINSKNTRSYKAFAVIPYLPLGGLMGLSQYVGAEDIDERGLFIAKVGQTNFYLNPNSTSLTAYVGIKDYNHSKSSAVFSPYQSTVIEAVDPDSGENTQHIYNRFAITASPLHEAGNEMLYKFDITL